MAYSLADNQITVYKKEAPTTPQAVVEVDMLRTLKTNEQVSYLGDELVYDTLHFEATQKRTFVNGHAQYGTSLKGFPYGSPARLENSGGGIDRYFYVDESKQIGVHMWSYDCASIIGMLDRMTFKGNVCNRNYFSSVLATIVGITGTLFDYDCSNVANVLVSGWLPFGTKRSALQQLLFATNVHAMWDAANQRVVFDYIDHTTAGTIADENIYDTGKVEYPQRATKIIVTEHAFFPYTSGSDKVVIFDNSTGYSLNGELVQFKNAPIIVSSIEAEGSITYTNASSDSAVVTGRGILRAYAYTHTTFQVERNSNAVDQEDYEVTVSDAYLVSVLNSENVADRVADYYFNRLIVKADIKYNSETCGHYYTLKDAFKTTRTGFLQKMDKVFSSFVKVACEFLCGVTEIYESNTFSHWQQFYYDQSNPTDHPQSGTWTVPSGVTKARVILIGGGNGGSSGIPGEPGDTSGNGGKGGDPGTPGDGGKIYEFTLNVTPGEVYNYYLGTGGAGGASLSYATYQNTHQANAGSPGGDTTFQKTGGTQYSSASGNISPVGWFCMANSLVMAKPGNAGEKGGDGGNAGENSDVAADIAQRTGKPGTGVEYAGTLYAGGSGGSGVFVTAPNSFAAVLAMTAQQIVNAGVYILQNGTKSLQTPQLAFAQGMQNLAQTGTQYCNAYGWKYQMGVSGGGGGGGALGAVGGNGAAGSNDATYPNVMCLDTDNALRDEDTYCWHEIDTTKGGNGGNGANAMTFSLGTLSGKGGNAGWGGGGGGGCASSRSGNQSVQWLMVEYAENATAPTPGAGGKGGAGQQGSYGGIVIYMT